MRLHSSKGEDLRERTFRFSVRIIKMVRRLPHTLDGQAIGQQVLRSGNSVAANMEEPDVAESQADFIHKIKLSLKEAQETRFRLQSLLEAEFFVDDEVRALLQESTELIKIITTIVTKTVSRASRA